MKKLTATFAPLILLSILILFTGTVFASQYSITESEYFDVGIMAFTVNVSGYYENTTGAAAWGRTNGSPWINRDVTRPNTSNILINNPGIEPYRIYFSYEAQALYYGTIVARRPVGFYQDSRGPYGG